MVKHPQCLKEAVLTSPAKSLRSPTQIGAFFIQKALSPSINFQNNPFFFHCEI
jgi:hypothetical protein